MAADPLFYKKAFPPLAELQAKVNLKGFRINGEYFQPSTFILVSLLLVSSSIFSKALGFAASIISGISLIDCYYYSLKTLIRSYKAFC